MSSNDEGPAVPFLPRLTLLPPEIMAEGQRLAERASELREHVDLLVLQHGVTDAITVRDVLHHANNLAGGEADYIEPFRGAEVRTGAAYLHAARPDQGRIVYVHHAPRLVDRIVEILGGNGGPDAGARSLVVGSGIAGEWEQVLWDLPFVAELQHFTGPGGTDADQDVQQDARRVLGLSFAETEDHVLKTVVLAHAAGVLLPVDALTRLLRARVGDGSVRAAVARVNHAVGGPLLRVVGEPREPHVGTSSEALALKLVRVGFFPAGEATRDDAVARCLGLFEALAPEDRAHRALFRSLLAGLARTGYRSVARAVVNRAAEALRGRWWDRLGTREVVDWANLCVVLQTVRPGLEAIQGRDVGSAREPYLALARARLLHVRARQHRTSPHIAEAKEAFRSILASHPRNPLAFHGYARFEQDVGEAPDASRAFVRAINHFPDNPIIAASASAFFIRTGALRRAREVLHRGRDLATELHDPTGPRLYFRHIDGEWHRRRWGGYDDLRTAEERFREVLDEDPGNLPSLVSLGTMTAERGHWATARHWLGRALVQDPEHPAALLKSGEVEAEGGELETGLGRLGSLLEIEPANLRALTALAAVRRRNSAWHEARRILERGASVDAENPYVMVERVQLLMAEVPGRLSDLDAERGEALVDEALESARKRRSGAGVVLAVRAELYRRTDRTQQAVAALRDAASAAVGSERIRVLNQWASMLLDEYESGGRASDAREASRLVDEALTLDPLNAFVLQTSARVKEAEGDDASGIRALQRQVREQLVSALEPAPEGFVNLDIERPRGRPAS